MNNTNSAAIAVSYNGSDPNDLDLILKSKTDDLALSDLIGNNRNWILQCASKTLKRYITDSDDEWSVSLLAFTEAVRNYDSEKGSFYPFTSVVIRRRLYDYLTSQQKHNNVIFVAPEVFSGESKEVEADRVVFSLQNQIMKAEIKAAEDDTAARAREEIGEMQSILAQYGFSFFDLADASPKAAKTKRSCARAIGTLIASAVMMLAMRLRKKLPAKDLSARSGVTIKILDRYRRYIIASAEILDGPFPILASYLENVRKEGETS